MNTMLGRLMFVVVLPLFVLIAGDLFQESQAGSFKSSCLRRCHRLIKNTAASKVCAPFVCIPIEFDTDCTTAYAQVCKHFPKEC